MTTIKPIIDREAETNSYYEKCKQLKKHLDRARSVCPPDEYQFRQNQLIYEIAKFLIEPYEEFLKRKEKS